MTPGKLISKHLKDSLNILVIDIRMMYIFMVYQVVINPHD